MCIIKTYPNMFQRALNSHSTNHRDSLLTSYTAFKNHVQVSLKEKIWWWPWHFSSISSSCSFPSKWDQLPPPLFTYNQLVLIYNQLIDLFPIHLPPIPRKCLGYQSTILHNFGFNTHQERQEKLRKRVVLRGYHSHIPSSTHFPFY